MEENHAAPLIPFTPRQIGTVTINTVNARDLHAFLEVKTRFNDWITRRIAQYEFRQDVDFISYSSVSNEGQINLIEYYLSFEMCKELSMVEKGHKGKQARLYFIECERRAQQAASQQVTSWDVLRQAVELGRQQEQRIKHLEASHAVQHQQLIEQQAVMIASQQAIIEANTKAELALRQQQWITLRQYVATNHLDRQLSPTMQKAYGQWLSGYCLEHNIPISREPVADRPYDAENRYHVGTIEATLPGWLARREGQPTLLMIHTTMATTH